MRTDLPTGTLTFLFTDIEGSTKLAAALGERWAGILERHQGILRDAFTSRGGVEVATEGDSFFVVFPSAPGAVAAAVAAQQALVDETWPDEVGQLRVRMGLHTGEGTLGADNYVGLDVHRAARVAAAGHGGQVLISSATRSLAEQNLPEGVTLRDLGEHRLKDLAQPERLAMLIVPGCPTDFPPLRTVDAVPNNLPVQLTSFVGRQREVAEASGLLLDGARLLTLTGPGGTGKTRLSLQVAAEVSDRFADGVFFVPLAPVTDPDLVASAIAQALQIPIAGNQPADERLRDWLAGKQILLVLDNFEQVLPAASLVGELLKTGESLRVLVSSRAPLRLYGEREFPVPSLGLPAQVPYDVDVLSQYEAVKLFIERAVAVRPDFAVTNENAPAVAMICARLDGLPLAIELAAARIKVLSPQAILPRLESSLDLLSAGARDLPERQRTLRGAIAWSWDLLTEPQRRVFVRFGVFVGGARLEEAEAVCAPDLGGDLLDAISELVDQSLLRQSEEPDGEPRFWMLGTIREYALERLDEGGDGESVRARHAEAYASLAERAESFLTGADQNTWLALLDREHDNLRAAIHWAIAAGEAELALRLISAPWRFWQFRGHLREAAARQAEVLAMPGAADVDWKLRYRALEATGGILYWSGDYNAAHRLYSESLDAARAGGDRALEAQALYNRAFTGEGDDPFMLMAKEGRDSAEEALGIWRELGNQFGVGQALWALGAADQFREEFDLAEREYDEALGIFRALDNRYYLGWSAAELGWLALRRRDWTAAAKYLTEALDVFRSSSDATAAPLLLDSMSVVAYYLGDFRAAYRLAGAANKLEREHGVGLAVVTRVFVDLPRVDELVDEHPEGPAELAAGEAMDIREAFDYAYDWGVAHLPSAAAASAPASA
jgi:predicted ATPase/class 3 adenylate cyclase